MIVTKYKKPFFTIKTINDLETYIKHNIYKDFKSITNKDKFINLLSTSEIQKNEVDNIIKTIVNNGSSNVSNRTIEYWINRGYTELESHEMISKLQKENSPRCIQYWISKGYTTETASFELSKYQTKIGKHNTLKPKKELRRLSHRCWEYWVDKGYTKEEALLQIENQQLKWARDYYDNITPEQLEKHKNFGEKNGMYGKPSPQGSGNGWSGWYNGLYFRSLHELNYIVNILERFNFNYKTAECKEYTINYIDFNNHEKTYRPDFIVNDRYLIEIKPRKLWNSESVKLKTTAGINFCNKNNLIYKLVDVGVIDTNQLRELYESNQVIFIDRYENKIKQYLYKTKEEI